MLKIFNCDFHVHTCLSPCAELDMHPGALVEQALNSKIDLIAVCDHNSSENVSYVIKAAFGKKIEILPGMEVTTKEEVHILAIFNFVSDLADMQRVVYNNLAGTNDENRFGIQAVVNENAEVEEINDKLLLGSVDLSLDEVISYIHKFNGIAVAAHIDRESFSVLSQLGFIDAGMNFDALEISAAMGIKEARARYNELGDYPFITSSDAHYIKDIGRAITKVLMEKPTLSELKMAFRKENGRQILE
ncbi:MAG: PHP domain-containing protein [Spirochaetes bacterium]|nr:PHP domain-containing protein [Spirochaetota bacterium]